ncbi:MAG: tRNA (adenosine(37)-N6)-threonylcarbamoyltransferase complex ATPase subunit type 1 TsaE [Ilumatobacteraceae bacterium]
MLTLRVTSLDGTRAVAAAVAGLARSGDVIVLSGEMGAGKTAFAQGFGAALGVDGPMTSPTYTLVHSYEVGRLTLHHADLYRLDTHHQVADLGLSELVEDDGILLVEWGDPVAASLGDHLHVALAHDTDLDDDSDPDGMPPSSRTITVTGVGRAWAPRWDRLCTALEALSC